MRQGSTCLINGILLSLSISQYYDHAVTIRERGVFKKCLSGGQDKGQAFGVLKLFDLS
jgi:hypothetical protein